MQIALGDLAEPGVVPQRDARRRHGRPPGRRDPRPAARLDRGADAVATLRLVRAAERAGVEAVHVLLGDRRVAALAGALLPGEGARRAGRRGGRARERRCSRRRSPTRRATRGSPCSTGCRGCPWRRSRGPATRCYQPIWADDVADCVVGALARARTATQRYELAGPEALTYDGIVQDRAARLRAPAPAAARAAARRARGAEGRRGVRRPVRVRDLGRGRADGALDDDAQRERRTPSRSASSRSRWGRCWARARQRKGPAEAGPFRAEPCAPTSFRPCRRACRPCRRRPSPASRRRSPRW